MNKFWHHLKTKALLGIILLAAVLRLYQINEIPKGFYWDEAAITYNAWGLAVWNRDEFGNKLPVSFKSFGDYKAPLLIYVLGGIYKVTGLHPEYLRILVALSGIGVVVLMYLLTRYDNKDAALAVAFFAAITPWSVHFSRFGSEAVFSLLLFLIGVLALKKNHYVLALFALVGAMYAYHSAKLVVPLFLLLWSIKNGKVIQKSKAVVSLSILIGCLLLFPMVKDMVVGSGFERGKSLIFFSDPSLVIQNLWSFMSLKFWILGADSIGLRHGVPGFGVLPKTLLLLLLVGIVFAFKKRQNRYLIIWMLIGLLPSIISTDAPHAIRAMLALPPVLILAAQGFSILKKPLKIVALILVALETCIYLFTYYSSYAINSATAFQYGYQEAILSAEKAADDNDTIIVTDFYGQPYIYTLLFRKLTPEEFKFGALANYEFHKISWPDTRPNRIHVATPEEINPSDPAVIKVITIPGSTIPVFVLTKT